MSASLPPRAPVGVWLIGARGSVATTVVAGCAALAAGLHPPTGMLTETPAFSGSRLPALSSLVFGGHDTAHCPLPKRAEALTAAGVLPHGLTTAVAAELAAADKEIRPGGPVAGDRREPEKLIAAFAADIQDFTRRTGAARTVVVNVASTEPAPHGTGLPPSSLYAAAALRAGCRTPAATARPGRPCCVRCSARCSGSAPSPSAPGRAPTCWAAATEPPSPTRPRQPPRTPARNGY
jgi:myo-inositol-1-phosphate synthase